MMFSRPAACWVLFAALAAAGCSRIPATSALPIEGEPKNPPSAVSPPSGKRPEPPPTPPAPAENPRVVKNQDAGIVRGAVRWTGNVPPAGSPAEHRVRIGGVEASVSAAPRLAIDPTTKGISDVAIWLEGAPEKARPPSDPVSLARERGRLRPAVQVVPLGTRLELRSSEDRADFQASGAATFSATLTRGQMRFFMLNRLGFVQIDSEEYPWITPAYVVVVPGTQGAVSGTDGRFLLADVRAGNYDLALWHAYAGKDGAPVTVRVPVKLAPGEGASVEWDVSTP